MLTILNIEEYLKFKLKMSLATYPEILDGVCCVEKVQTFIAKIKEFLCVRSPAKKNIMKLMKLSTNSLKRLRKSK